MSSPPTQIRYPVSLRRLFPSSSFVGCADLRVTEATDCSTECSSKTLFAAIPGTRVDGATFIKEAIGRGATALLVGRPVPDVSVPQCVVANVRKAYAELWSALCGSPSRQLKLAGVTGTNGKTTLTWLVRAICRAAGRQTGLLGTIEYDDGLQTGPSRLTTPDSRRLAQWLAAMVARRTTHAAIEVSSHALDQDRIAGTRLDAAVVTNITQDHFDYHHGYQAYLHSKARLLEHLKPGGVLVLNADDPGAVSLGQRIDAARTVVTYGIEKRADIGATVLHESLSGSRFELRIRDERIEVTTRLVGRHNVSNCLAAAAVAERFGLALDEIAGGIASLGSIPGRLERIDGPQPFEVFVDYAHTEDALRNAVRFLRRLTRGRVICVFGAGGDRDRSKRPLLGRAAAEADLAVVTSDNPRSEHPDRIIREILPGLAAAGRRPHVEPDRAAAIRWALERAEPGDAVLIAGKGHETEQIIGGERLPFDDREVARRSLVPAPHFLRKSPLHTRVGIPESVPV
jgi:UDP-N-acetylmuramoyl-L-alanyl-D-glutamate--2,6-diaminopimelate ligase